MIVDELWLVGGSEIRYADGVTVYQPKLSDIWDPQIGTAKYEQYVNIFGIRTSDLFGKDERIPSEILTHMHIFDVLTGLEDLRKVLTEALNFFVAEEVVYYPEERMYRTDCGGVIQRENFEALANIILHISCMKTREPEAPKFSSEKAQRIYEKIKKGRETASKMQKNANSDMSLSNIISKVSAKSSSYNLLNIGGLTVWQLFDQFACLCLNSQIEIVGLRWAAWGKEDFDFAAWYKKNT